MSEKQLKFTLESDRQYIGIFDEGYALTGFEVCNLLNSLYQQCEALQDENEQLRQEQQRLYNYFRDYLEDEMSAENFGEMWDTVKVDERWNDE